jgi:cysteine-rich repeat protein
MVVPSSTTVAQPGRRGGCHASARRSCGPLVAAARFVETRLGVCECDDGNVADADGCQATCRWTKVHDSVLVAPSPLSLKFLPGQSEVNRDIRVSVNPVTRQPLGYTTRVSIDHNDCPAGTATNAGNGMIRIRATRTSFPNASARIPQRCTLRLGVVIEPADVDDPNPSNNTAPLELNVFGDSEPASGFVLHSVRRPPGRILASYDAMVRFVRLTVEASPSAPADRSLVLSTSDSTCPPGTFGAPDFDQRTSAPEDTVTVVPGRRAMAKLPVTLDAAVFTTPSRSLAGALYRRAHCHRRRPGGFGTSHGAGDRCDRRARFLEETTRTPCVLGRDRRPAVRRRPERWTPAALLVAILHPRIKSRNRT